ncbi:unnamed protein product [Callosobruchus maculatus]|uniref:Cilia- and flagella-associated protein 206 n=1 Tax=Callosobruchus maculatus TaxID=64391 RepID=A0A653BY42_CALMS|nr:unnamed protein product [Callosobruchus maculatus]
MGGRDSDDILVRNIQRETLEKCMDRQTLRVLPSEKFVTFIVKLHLQNPAWGITENFMACRENVQQLVKHLITLLESHRHPILVALKLQYFYQCCMEHFDSSVQDEKNKVTRMLSPLKAEILNTKVRDALDEPELLEKRIISYILLLIGLGNPQKAQVYNETFYALKSVMDSKEMLDFIQEEEEAKEQQLKELVYVIGGIRIFNKYSGKCVGWDIKNIVESLASLITTMKTTMLEQLEHTTSTSDLMRVFIDKIYVMNHDVHDIGLRLVMPHDVTVKDVEKIKFALGTLTTYNTYLKDMLRQLDEIAQNLQQIHTDLLKKVEEMCEIISQKVATAADVIFPEFIDLCSRWVELGDLLIPVSKIYAIWTKLNAIKREVQFHRGILEVIAEEKVRDTTDFKSASDSDLQSFNPHVTILSAEECEGFDRQQIECQCYCPFKFVETQGGLFHGDIKKHMSTFEGRTYAFSSAKAKAAFSQKPKKYVNELLLFCLHKPPYIEILNMKSRLEEVEIETIIEDKQLGPKFELSKEIQCDSDYESFVPPPENDDYEYDLTDMKKDSLKIDKLDRFEKTKKMVSDILKVKAKYRWSIWDMRKDALELAKLTCHRTTSVKTTNTHATTSQRLQTYFPRNKRLHTKKDNYSNTPKPSNFILGLRNPESDKQFVVDLTLPTDM